MANNKSGEYVVNMSNLANGNSEKELFLDRSPLSPSVRPTKTLASATQASNSPIVSILAYCLSSLSMTIVNKYVVSGSFWNLNFFYLAMQAIVSTTAIAAARQLRLFPDVISLEWDRARKWFPVSLILVCLIYTGNKSLQFLSVPVYTIFKNLGIIVTAYGEVLWFGGSVTRMALLSFGLMVLSSIVAAAADIQNALAGHASSTSVSTLNVGYAWMGLNVLCSAAYTLGMRRVIRKMHFKDWDSMYYNNILTIPVLITCSLLTEDWSSDNFAKNFPEESRNHLMVGIVYSGLAALFISYCSAWCIRVTSSTTYSMVGALNKLPIAICGLIFFAAPVTFGSVSAIILGFISGIVYAVAKARNA
ncbi:UDP-galactose transporter [Thozetella sp. PMI_491]|nr:UDP-galactose transporter [Thozetella sp. PMI_491]